MMTHFCFWLSMFSVTTAALIVIRGILTDT